MKKFILIIVSTFVLSACGTGGAEEGKNYKKIDIQEFNVKIDSALLNRESWVEDPSQVVAKFFENTPISKTRSMSYEITNMGEVANEVLIKVKDEGLLDDSLEGELWVLTLKRSNGVWHITEGRECWKCKTGRGSSSFDTIPCN
jgi:hypothetical protein